MSFLIPLGLFGLIFSACAAGFFFDQIYDNTAWKSYNTKQKAFLVIVFGPFTWLMFIMRGIAIYLQTVGMCVLQKLSDKKKEDAE